MHKLTAGVILVIIAVAIGIVIFSSSAQESNQTGLYAPTPLQDQEQANNPTPATLSGDTDEEDQVKYTQATIVTTKGNIELELYPEEAPGTVANFAEKANDRFYEDLIFHRVEDWVVQGGDPEGDGTGGGQMPTELNSLPFLEGSLGVARGGNIQVSNDSQFFITKSEADWLDGQYTNFGKVTSGMDVVNSLEIGDEIVSITVAE